MLPQIMRFKLSLLFICGVLGISHYAHAQNISFTDPSAHDLKLAHAALTSCRVLADVVDSNSGVEDDIPSEKLFLELQKQDPNGNLLIDNEACRDSILEFVSSLCSSNSYKNNLYCQRLGIQKTSDRPTNDYKKFGQSAIDALDIELTDNINFQQAEETEEDQSTIKFLAAGTLFSLNPIRKFRLASLVGKNMAARVKPVLNGALLLLATFGVSSCSDATEPEAYVCNGHSFSLNRNDGSRKCINLPQVTVSYIDEAGNEQAASSGITSHSIQVKFDSVVGYIHDENWQALTKENLLDILKIKLADSTNFLDETDQYNVEIGVRGGSYILITPVSPYPAGRHTITVKGYAPESDALSILNSTNKLSYLQKTKQDFSFKVDKVETPCTRGEEGYFQLENAECITLPTVDYTFLTSYGAKVDSSNSDSQTTIKIKFDSDVVFVDGSGWSEITNQNVLNMLEITKLSGASSTSSGSNGQASGFVGDVSISKSNQNSTGTLVTIHPSTPYAPGEYKVAVSNYAKRQDADKIDGNSSYFDIVKQEVSFTVAANVDTPCSRNEAGYFQLEGSNASCIKLPTVNYTFVSSDGVETASSNEDAAVTIKIKFDSEIVLIDSSEWYYLTEQNVLDIIEIKKTGGADLAVQGGPIGQTNISISGEDTGTLVTVSPPASLYESGDYTVTVGNYAKRQDAGWINQSTNSSLYFEAIKNTAFFRVGSLDTPCTRGEVGYFQLEGSGTCIQLPTVEYTFVASDGAESNFSNGDPQTTVKIKFDSDVVFVDNSGYSDLTNQNVLKMLEITRSGGDDLSTLGGYIDQDNISISREGAGTLVTVSPPANLYTPGVYKIVVGNYAKRQDADKVHESNSVNYFNVVKKESTYSIDDTGTPCFRKEAGYFQLEGPNRACIKLPEVSYSFNGGSRAVLPTNAEAVIKIEFDSEVVFLDASGYSDLTAENLLQVLDVTHDNQDFYRDFIRYYEEGSISVTNADSKTVITIDAPREDQYGNRAYPGQLLGDLTLKLGKYAKKENAQRISQSMNTSDYLESVYKEKSFIVSASCRYSSQTSSNLAVDALEQEERKFYDTDLVNEQKSLLELMRLDPNLQTVEYNKADPDTTYYIDILFVASQSAMNTQVGSVLNVVNKIFQNSGVNVEFRYQGIVPFSHYKQHLGCSDNLESLDGVYSKEGLNVFLELAPEIRKDYSVDLIYGLMDHYDSSDAGGTAYRRLKDYSGEMAARFSSVGTLDTTSVNSVDPLDINYRSSIDIFATKFARQLGFNLGLNNDIHTILHHKGEYPDPDNLHSDGYGYGGRYNVDSEIGTIMSHARDDQQISLFSSSEVLKKSEICQTDKNAFGSTYGSYGYCNNNEYNDPVPEDLDCTKTPDSDHCIRIGDTRSDASKALQYTIEDASNYNVYCHQDGC